MKVTLAGGQRWYPSQGYLWLVVVVLTMMTLGFISVTVSAVYLGLAWGGLVAQGSGFQRVAQWSATLLQLDMQLLALPVAAVCMLAAVQRVPGAASMPRVVGSLMASRHVYSCAALFFLLSVALREEKHGTAGPVVATAIVVAAAIIGTPLVLKSDAYFLMLLKQSARNPMFPIEAVEDLPDMQGTGAADKLAQRWARPDALWDARQCRLYSDQARRSATVRRYTGQLLGIVGSSFISAAFIWYFSGRAPLTFWSVLVTLLPLGVAMGGYFLVRRADFYDHVSDEYAARAEAIAGAAINRARSRSAWRQSITAQRGRGC